VLPRIHARHRQRRADEAAVGLCACESGGSRRGPARLRERRRARGGLEERDARPLGCRLPRDALVERVAAKCSRLCAYRWSGYSSPCTRKMKMQRGLKKPLESVLGCTRGDIVTCLQSYIRKYISPSTYSRHMYIDTIVQIHIHEYISETTIRMYAYGNN
jgi:hypothetical protein